MKKGITKSELLELMSEHYINEQPNFDDAKDDEQGNDGETRFNDPEDLSQYTPNDDLNEPSGTFGSAFKINKSKLKVPRYFSSDKLRVGLRQGEVKTAKLKMAGKNPRDGKIVNGLVVADEMITTENGETLYLIKNYGIPRTKLPYTINFMDTKPQSNGEYEFYTVLPRSQDLGTKKSDKYKKEDYTESEKVGYVKRRVSSNFNQVFNNQALLNKLKSLFVSRIVGDYRYTEQSTNVTKLMKWGTESSDINFSYNSVIDDETLNKVLKGISQNFSSNDIDIILNGEGMEDINDELDMLSDIQIQSNEFVQATPAMGDEDVKSDYMRRAYAGYIYTNGEWKHNQRVANLDTFIKHGKYTNVYHLKKKNIQEGRMGVSSRSDILVDGKIIGGSYIMNITYKTELVLRNKQAGFGTSVNDIIKPIVVVVRRELPEGINSMNFKLGESKNDLLHEFLFNANDGLLVEALQELASVIMGQDSGEVIDKVMNLIIDASSSSINESFGKKIKITEEQLNRLKQQLNEEKFDDTITNFNRTKESNVPVNHDDINLLFNIAKDWCQNRPENPDCKEIATLKDKLKLY